MALKVLMLRKEIDEESKKLSVLREKDVEFQQREAELEEAIAEAGTDEERSVVEAEIETYEQEKNAHEEEKVNLETEVAELEAQLKGEEERQRQMAEKKKEERENMNRKEVEFMDNRTRFFGMTPQERNTFLMRDDVKEFLQRTRELAKQTRAITGADLLIPDIVLDLVRENIEGYSKLYKHVSVRRVPGTARQNVMGAIPEAVWTEMCATLNELDLSFTQVEVDGYKVGGFIAVCNAILEDSDIALATEIIHALGQAIGYALDKAILYGTGTKMPFGIVTRLAQTVAPSDYPAKTRPWVDLSTSNLLSASGKTDAALYKSIVELSGAAKGKYSRGTKFWAMNETTYTKLVANALTINAAGAIVSGQTKEMPVIGGHIETLEFIPDGHIIGGYGDAYLLVERAGTAIARSEHVRFIEDQTVFKGTARYDGIPVISEAFVGISLTDTLPAADDVTFVPDTANTGE